MRKLKLQMQMSIDGYIARAHGEMDWMVMNWGEDIKKYVTDITATVDHIILGSKLAKGFIDSWESRAENPDTTDDFAKKMTDTQKIVFTKTLQKVDWKNTVLAKGDLASEVNNLKNKAGGDIIVYGGGTFVSSLIQENLIDEFHLFINPVALGSGMTIFDSEHEMKLIKSMAFDCGIVVVNYTSANTTKS